MNAIAIQPPVARVCAPLRVEPGLRRFEFAVRAAYARGGDDIRQARRRSVLNIITRALRDPECDTVVVFEDVLNGCLDVGYRAQPLAAYVFAVLQRRLASRVRRRLAQSRQDPDTEEVSDLVAQAIEAIQRLIRGARRERHTLRYALLVSIADHRTIDFLRRRRPEYRETMDDHSACGAEFALHTACLDPERALLQQQRNALALQLRDAVIESVNSLSEACRAALVLVEIDGLGYPEVAERLGIKVTDVGNIVRRARLARDRNLVPKLRTIPGLAGHVGFSAIQENRDLRLQMLTWSAEVGEGLCEDSLADGYRLVAKGCPEVRRGGATQASPDGAGELVADF